MNGFVNINKPRDMTSNDVVVKVRGILKAVGGDKKLKVGHLGTLDPLATGVLPIAVGRATRLFDLLLAKSKTYVATFKFGQTTPTLDSGSEICENDDIVLTDSEIASAISHFVGEIEQVPPQFSAKSVGGKRAYDLARNGEFVNLEPKKVTVYSINPLNLENLSQYEFAFEIVCSSGTYIRALARDIAAKLGTVGYMTSLLRTQSGKFALENSVSISDFQLDPLKYILPIDFALADMKCITLDEDSALKAQNGLQLNVPYDDGTYKIVHDGETIAIGRVFKNKLKLEIRL